MAGHGDAPDHRVIKSRTARHLVPKEDFMKQSRSPQDPGHTEAVLAYDRHAGQRTHLVVARISSLPVAMRAQPSLPAATAEARAVMRLAPMARGRDAALQRMAFAGLAYWTQLLPSAVSGYVYLGSELRFGRLRVDGAFGRNGKVFFDEIKAGRWQGSTPDSHRAQVDTYLAAGVDALGADFLGLRYLNLTDSAGRFWVTPDGRWSPYRADLLVGHERNS